MCRHLAWAAAAASLVLISACRFDDTISLTGVVACAADIDCPSTTCDPVLHRCVSSALPFTLTVPISPRRGRAGDTFTLSLATTPATPDVLKIIGLSDLGAEVANFEFDAAAGHFAWSSTGTEPEGRVRVFVGVKNNAPVALSAMALVDDFELDFTPPLATDVTLTVLPRADDPLVVNGLPGLLTAGRPGAAIDVSFSFNEATPLPRVSLQSDAGLELPMVPTAAPRGFRASTTLPNDVASSAFHVVVNTADFVGNTTRLEIATLDVKATAPAAPTVNEPGAVLYRRAPWGRGNSKTPHFEIIGAPGSAPGAVAVIATVNALTLGKAQVTPAGFTLPVVLANDEPVVRIHSIDAAGNLSAGLEVQDVEWSIAALQADAGTLRQRGTFEPWSDSWNTGDVADGEWNASGTPKLALENSSRLFGRTLMTRAGLVGQANSETWFGGGQLVRPLGLPECSKPGASTVDCEVYDLENERRLCLGSGVYPVVDGGTMAITRVDSAAVWHDQRHAALWFGGTDTSIAMNTAYWFDGAVLEPIAGPLPPPRFGHAMAYDARNNRVFIVGGQRGTTLLNDTWSYQDGGFVEVPGPPPDARIGASLAWDDDRQRFVLAGGAHADRVTLHDTWVFDDQWRKLPAVNEAFSALPNTLRSVPSEHVMLWGSFPPYVLSGDEWVELPVSFTRGASLGPRPYAAVGYSPETRTIVTACGTTPGSSNEVSVAALKPRAWSNWSWSVLDINDSPPCVGGQLKWSAATHSFELRESLRFATEASSSEPEWVALNQSTRHHLSLDAGWSTNTLPLGGASARTGSFTFDDPARHRTLFHSGFEADGGVSNQTWALLDDGRWQLLDLGPVIDARRRMPTTREALRDFTWSRWAAEPGGAAVLISPGAQNSFDQTWATQRPAGLEPMLQSTHPVTGELLALVNGAFFTLRGGQWVSASLPLLSMNGSMVAAVDPLSRHVVLGGDSRPSWSQVLDFTKGQPVEEFVLPLELVGLTGVDQITSASFRVRARGQGESSDGGAADGFAMLMRHNGRLQPALGAPQSADAGEATLEMISSDVAFLRRWLRPDDGGVQYDVGIGATTLGRSGVTDAHLTTSELEATLTYRRGAGHP